MFQVSAMVLVKVYILPRCMECRCDLAMRILSVRPSVKRLHCDKTEERSVLIFYVSVCFFCIFSRLEYSGWT